MTSLQAASEISLALLVALVIRTLIEILRLGIRASNKATIDFYVKAALIAAIGILVVLTLQSCGFYLAACVTSAIIIVALAVWKVRTKAYVDR